MLQLMDDTIKQIEARISSNKNGITGLPTGFSDLDRLTCGWQPGDEVVIAARPAVGKTSFALHLARAAASAGYHIAIFSLEMLGERLGDRWLLAGAPQVKPPLLLAPMSTPTMYAAANLHPVNRGNCTKQQLSCPVYLFTLMITRQ